MVYGLQCNSMMQRHNALSQGYVCSLPPPLHTQHVPPDVQAVREVCTCLNTVYTCMPGPKLQLLLIAVPLDAHAAGLRSRVLWRCCVSMPSMARASEAAAAAALG